MIQPSENKDLTEVWNIQLDLVKKLLDVCNKHKLNIWAYGGTLLGAIRHNGFIPWDDDIDMVMFREDYDKLIKIADQEFKHPYFFQCAYTEKGYYRGHAQLRNSNTSGLLPGDLWQSFNQGIFIDIFVHDYIPVDEDCQKYLFKELENIRYRLHNRMYGSFLQRNPINSLKYLYSCIYYYINSPIDDFKKMESLILNFPKKSDKYVSHIMFWTSDIKKYTFDVKCYSDTIWHKFEDIEIPIPKGYDELLTTQYGEYMKPLRQPTTHGTMILNVNRPYNEELREQRKSVPFKAKLHHFFSIKSKLD